jgi:hypothetical protein
LIKDGLKVNGKCYQDEVLLLVYSNKKTRNSNNESTKLTENFEFENPEDSELVIFI